MDKKTSATLSSEMNYYHQAESHALKANEFAADARETRSIYEELRSTIIRWDEIMANTYPWVWAVFFLIIATVEFLFSIDLYTDLLPFAPWIIPIGIIVVTVFISHAIAVRAMPSLRDKEFSDKKHNHLYQIKTDEEINEHIRKNSKTNFIIGLMAAIGITVVIFLLSKERVLREIEAGMRIKPFGAYDTMPVIFYIAEVGAGILILYLIKRVSKGIKAWRTKRMFDKLVRQVAMHTDNAVSSFETAEKNGFCIIENTISESIHIAFYRNKNCNPSDEIAYISEPANIVVHTKFKITRADNTKPLLANIHLLTEYNYTVAGATDNSGTIELEFSSFANDTIKRIIAEFSDGTDCEDSGTYSTDNSVHHTIMFRE